MESMSAFILLRQTLQGIRIQRVTSQNARCGRSPVRGIPAGRVTIKHFLDAAAKSFRQRPFALRGKLPGSAVEVFRELDLRFNHTNKIHRHLFDVNSGKKDRDSPCRSCANGVLLGLEMTFYKTDIFTGQIVSLVDDDSYTELQTRLITDPEAGDLIPRSRF